MTLGFSDDDARRADDEAVEWVILLREAPDNSDVQEHFQAWLAASVLNARAWAETSRAYDRAGDVRPAFSSPVRAAERRPVLPPGPAAFARRGNPAILLGPARDRVRPRGIAAAAAAVCLALIAAPSLTLRAQADHITGTAELDAVRLADGSIAQLAPGSAIAVSYAHNRRQVRLLKGEAWFDVRHDPARPFYVDANGVTTTVLGTAFDVRLDGEGVTAELARGRVRIDYARGAPPVSEQLSPGQTAHVAFDGIVTRDNRPVDQIGAWRDRQIAVHDRPASEVVEALRPWFAGVIIMRGDDFARQRVTGLYDATDPLRALQGLTRAYGGSVTRVTPWVLIVTAN